MDGTYYTASLRVAFRWPLPDPESLKVATGVLRGRTSAKFADLSRLVEPPHVLFANLGYDPNEPLHHKASESEITKFVKRYGPLEPTRTDKAFEVSLGGFRYCQWALRHAWEVGDARYFTEPWDAVLYHELEMDKLRVNLKATPGGLELHPVSCLASMNVLLARDLSEGIAKKCRNPKCIAPYFIAKRRDAQYCSHRCASDVNVKRFLERQRAERKKSRRRKVK